MPHTAREGGFYFIYLLVSSELFGCEGFNYLIMSANENKKRKSGTIDSFFKRIKNSENKHDGSGPVETVSTF